MNDDPRTSHETVPPAAPWPADVTPEEIEAFRTEDLLKVVDRSARILVMSGVVLIVFFAFPSLVFSDSYVFCGYRGVSLAWAYCIFGPALLIAGIALGKRWFWARMVSLVIAWAAVPVCVLLAVLLVRMVVEASRQIFWQSLGSGGHATWVPAAILGVVVAPGFIVGLLRIRKCVGFLSSDDVKALFRREPDAPPPHP